MGVARELLMTSPILEDHKLAPPILPAHKSEPVSELRTCGGVLSLISFPDFFVGVPILDDEIVGVPTQPFPSAFA